MAFSCVKVSFEVGHEASLRNKRTLEGFTHDWQVFVRGADNTDISQFVDRVIFYLHETFPKPKRIIKSPPYSVKESGYAGFELSIDVYFKTQDAEPKKVRFNYDLTLQPSGPPISKVIRETYEFPNPPEDLRRRLIKGGGVGVTGGGGEVGRFASSPDKTSAPADSVPPLKPPVPLVGKPKLGGEGGKKQKIKEHKPVDEPPRVNNQFTDLFGPTIHKTKVSPDPDPKRSSSQSSKSQEKTSNDKHSSKSLKHIPQKEVKQIGNSKEETKEHSKERDKSKEKLKQSPSSPKRLQSPKRPSTPPTKRSITPSKRSSPPHKRPVTPKPKDDVKKSSEETQSKTDSKSSDSKSEKKKKDKKSKDDKSKKSKVKGHEKKNSDTGEKADKSRELKDKEKKITKDIISKESDKIKTKHSEPDKEKQKHKHKKKDRNKEEDGGGKEKSKDKIKTSKKVVDKVNEVKDFDKNGVGKESRHSSSAISTSSKKQAHSDSPSPVRLVASPVKQTPAIADKPSSSKDKPHPLKRLLEELTDHESSDSNNSPLSEEDSFDPPMTKSIDKFSQSSAAKTIESIENVVNSYEHSPANNKTMVKKTKEGNVQEKFSPTDRNGKHKDKSEPKKSKDKKKVLAKSETKEDGKLDSKDVKKRKRSSSLKDERTIIGELPEKILKKTVDSTVSDSPVAVLKGNQPVAMEVERPISPEVRDTGTLDQHKEVGTLDERFTADYVAQLKELQQKIMTLEDNDELQRVVQVIAETGQYEITKKTFDFDLCALDQRTVKRLQDFFIAS